MQLGSFVFGCCSCWNFRINPNKSDKQTIHLNVLFYSKMHRRTDQNNGQYFHHSEWQFDEIFLSSCNEMKTGNERRKIGKKILFHTHTYKYIYRHKHWCSLVGSSAAGMYTNWRNTNNNRCEWFESKNKGENEMGHGQMVFLYSIQGTHIHFTDIHTSIHVYATIGAPVCSASVSNTLYRIFPQFFSYRYPALYQFSSSQ